MTKPRTSLISAAKAKRHVKDVDVRGADLSGAKLFKLKADGLRADGANLRNARLEVAGLMDCDFRGAHCEDADFGGATLWQCNFDQCHGERAKFHGTHAEVNWWRDADLRGATFARAKLAHSGFLRSRLDRADFSDVVGEAVDFSDARLDGAWFRGAQFKNASFARSGLTDADFTLTDLRGADFRGAVLTGAGFSGARIDGAMFDGDAPDTSNAPPSADLYRCLQAHLRAGETEACLKLWHHVRKRVVWDAAASAIDPTVQPAAAVGLLKVLVDDAAAVVVHAALYAARVVALAGWELAPIVPTLVSLLPAKRVVHVPRHSGEVRRTLDSGLSAAIALGYLSSSVDVARTALEAGLEGQADVRERSAAGLTVAAACGGRTDALDDLARSTDSRIRRGVCAGLEALRLDRDELERHRANVSPRIGDFARMEAAVKRLARDRDAGVKKAAARIASR